MKIASYLYRLHTEYLIDCMDSISFEDHIREEGRDQGLEIKLIEQIQKKLVKGKSAGQIADELEEPLANVEHICKIVENCGLHADTMKIYEHLHPPQN